MNEWEIAAVVLIAATVPYFDIRAFDTLGEEFILFASVSGVALLLRQLRDEKETGRAQGIEDHRFAGASPALRTAALVLIPLVVALGLEVTGAFLLTWTEFLDQDLIVSREGLG